MEFMHLQPDDLLPAAIQAAECGAKTLLYMHTYADWQLNDDINKLRPGELANGGGDRLYLAIYSWEIVDELEAGEHFDVIVTSADHRDREMVRFLKKHARRSQVALCDEKAKHVRFAGAALAMQANVDLPFGLYRQNGDFALFDGTPWTAPGTQVPIVGRDKIVGRGRIHALAAFDVEGLRQAIKRPAEYVAYFPKSAIERPAPAPPPTPANTSFVLPWAR